VKAYETKSVVCEQKRLIFDTTSAEKQEKKEAKEHMKDWVQIKDKNKREKRC